MSERLQFIRVRSRLTAVIRFSGDDKVQRALTRDVGVTGVCLLSETPLKSGELISVELLLPDRTSKPLAFTGEVVWSKRIEGATEGADESAIESGVRFVTIDPKERALLMQWVALNAQHPTLGDR